MIEEITPIDAQILQQQGWIYLDVRTVEEFAEGHAPGAVNLPMHLLDPSTGRLTPNNDFMHIAQQIFAPNAKLLLGCKSGGRSMAACQALADCGFGFLKNITGGFYGKPGPGGTVIVQGWVQSNLPVATEDEPGKNYEKLKNGSAEE